jgi:hypothetical protein
MAARLLHDFPRSLGLHPTLKEEMLVNLGHYPNLRVGNRSFGLLSQVKRGKESPGKTRRRRGRKRSMLHRPIRI